MKIFASIFLAASIYALGLQTERGRRFADENTAESVMVGVGMVLVALRPVLRRRDWRKVALAFFVAGLPMVSRSWWNRGDGLRLNK